MTKEKLKDLILQIIEIDGSLTLLHTPKSVIYDTEELYGLYYSGSHKIIIGRRYCKDGVDINTAENIDIIVDEIYEKLDDDISKSIQQYMKEIDEEYELLKYFDRDSVCYGKFRKGVLKIKNNGKI